MTGHLSVQTSADQSLLLSVDVHPNKRLDNFVGKLFASRCEADFSRTYSPTSSPDHVRSVDGAVVLTKEPVCEVVTFNSVPRSKMRNRRRRKSHQGASRDVDNLLESQCNGVASCAAGGSMTNRGRSYTSALFCVLACVRWWCSCGDAPWCVRIDHGNKKTQGTLKLRRTQRGKTGIALHTERKQQESQKT